MAYGSVAITAGAGTDIAVDTIASKNYQRVKVTHGAEGTANDANSTTPLPVATYPVVGTGLTVHRKTSAASANATNVKASAGVLHKIIVTNSNTSARYLKFYNSGSAPTVGSGTPHFDLMIPGGGGVVADLGPQGLAFSSGIGYTMTTGAADSDNGTVAADEIKLTLGYI